MRKIFPVYAVEFFVKNKLKESRAMSMNVDAELLAFLEAAKRAKKADLLNTLKTDQLETLHYEIAEDPEIEKAIKKIIK